MADEPSLGSDPRMVEVVFETILAIKFGARTHCVGG
jgi:hypothetical protein